MKKQNVYAFIFYDNIDHLVPVAQKNIIVKLLSLNEIAKVKKILCVRRSTKSKYDKLAVKNKMLRRRITLLETLELLAELGEFQEELGVMATSDGA